MKKYYVGIDLGGISAKAGVVDEEGNLLCTVRRETSAENPPERTAEHLAALAEEAIKKSGIGRERVIAIGVGSPGVIDSARGEVVVWSNFHWKDVPLSALVFRDSGLPVWLVNDANAAALGEAKYGSGKNCSDSVTVTLGTGVGGGIVLGGKLFEGFRSAGGELGHMVLRRGGVRCTCGRRGCFECYASATALKRMTREAIGRHAKAVVKKYIGYLGEGIANLVNLLRPEIVIIGGGVSNEGEYLLSRLERVVFRNLYAPLSYAPLSIVRASLGNDAGILGAAAYAMSRERSSLG